MGSRRPSLTRCLFAVGLAASLGPAWACAPDSDPSYLAGSWARELELPAGDYATIVHKALVASASEAGVDVDPETRSAAKPYRSREEHRAATIAQDTADLAQALKEAGIEPASATATVTAYRKFRTDQLSRVTRREEHQRWESWNVDPQRAIELIPLPLPKDELLASLPGEFALYVLGAQAYYDAKLDAAVDAWRRVLALPPSERRFRSTWAAAMLARALLQTESRVTEGLEYCERYHALCKEGFPDSLGLADQFEGWRARAECRQGDLVSALRRYIRLRDELSIRWVCGAATSPRGVDSLPKLLNEPDLRPLVVAYAMRRSRVSTDVRRVVEVASELGPADDAGRLAWVAYKQAMWPQAERLAELAPASDPCAAWVRGKLALRNADFARAEACLAGVTPASLAGIEGAANLLGDLGFARMQQRDYASALEAFIDAGEWCDAGYLADRILTVDELLSFLESRGESLDRRADDDRWGYYGRHRGFTITTWLRDIAARRLARADRWDEARAYYPSDWVIDTQFVTNWQAYQDEQRPLRERAQALFDAAQLMHDHGMDLVGTEVEPDWNTRACDDYYLQVNDRRRVEAQASDDERLRYRAHACDPDRRHHYLYNAAETMYECGMMLPKNDDLAARAFIHGGRWLESVKDLERADVFYKTLVRRCRQHPLGIAADKRRWFPKLE